MRTALLAVALAFAAGFAAGRYTAPAERHYAVTWASPEAPTVVVGEFATYGNAVRVAHEVRAAHPSGWVTVGRVRVLRDGYELDGDWR